MISPCLLVIGYVWPEPNSSAAGSRMLELIQLFKGSQWRVVFASAAALSEHRFDLNNIGVDEKIIALNCSSFDEWLATLNPQAVLFDRFFTEEQFGWRVEKCCPDALRLLDTEDLHCLRHARHRLLKALQKQAVDETARQSVGPVTAYLPELYAEMSFDDMAQREIAAIYRCDLSIMISTVEITLLKKYFSVPDSILCYVPFLTKPATAKNNLPSFDEREHFIAIGNFRHEPNWDSVLYLKQVIWPLIRAQLPYAELHIYGAYPPPKAMQLHQPKHGFLMKGWAVDAHSVMRSAKICLAPLRFGAGIKGKLVDAMRNGTPSVTTTIGAESMCGDLPWNGAVENNTEAFAMAAVKLYRDSSVWKIAQENGFAILENYFFRCDFSDQLMQRVDYVSANLVAERRKNFTGAMLRHHSLKSTQYMSQWIEAKNRT